MQVSLLVAVAGAGGAGAVVRHLLAQWLKVLWPDLPLAAVWVQLGEDSATWASLMRNALGRPVEVLDAERLFPGLNALVPAPAERQALLPVLGALLRTETRLI